MSCCSPSPPLRSRSGKTRSRVWSRAEVARALGVAVRRHGYVPKDGQHVFAAAIAASLLIVACSTPTVAPLPEPIRPPKPVPEQATDRPVVEDEAELEAQRVTPAPDIPEGPSMADVSLRRMGADLEGPPIGVSFNDAPLPVFINEVFSERLGLSFHISPGLREKTDLVTLRLADPVPPAQLFDAARQALRYYGVDIVEEEDGLLTFVVTEDATPTGEIPLLVSGRTLPEVPSTHREIFHLVPLHIVGPNQVTGMLRMTFGDRLQVSHDGARNALLLRGKGTVIRRALTMLDVLDQPLLRGRTGVIIETRYLDAQKVAGDLRNVLRAEGYVVDEGTGQGRSGVLILPLESINKLVAFAYDEATLTHLQEWAVTLDQRRQQSVDDAWFTYQVQSAKASELVETLNEVVARVGDTPRVADAADSSPRAAPVSRSRARRVVVDEPRNMILYRGSGREWAQILTVIEALDKPAPMVLVEAVIAEISLNDMDGSGIEFLARAALDSRRGARIRTLDALGVQANALSLTVDSAGNTRALLNLFYEDSRVVIRSLPKVVVRSGEAATFSSGNDIPAIVQIADSGTQTDGTTSLLQQVQYRQTGVDLTVTPTAQANGSVDLDISLTLSEARPTAATSLTGSPTVLQRALDTKLSLRDGGSTVLGGLVSDSQSIGQTGVPGIGRVPVLGRLFRTDSLTRDRTELVVMVIAYIIADHREAGELTERLKAGLELHRQYSQ